MGLPTSCLRLLNPVTVRSEVAALEPGSGDDEICVAGIMTPL